MSEPFLSATGNEKRTTEVRAKEVIIREQKGIDLNLLKKRTSSKTFEGWLLGQMKMASKNENLDMAKSLEFIYKKYKEYSDSEKVRLDSWKGKSSFTIIEHPDSFDIITFQKPDKDSEPKEIKRNITKQEVNDVLVQIHILNQGKQIKTRDIAEAVYHEKWKDIFSNRFEHTNLNLILRLLDKKGIIEYNGGKTKLK